MASRLLAGDFVSGEMTVNLRNYSFLPAHEGKSGFTLPATDSARQTKLIISFEIVVTI